MEEKISTATYSLVTTALCLAIVANTLIWHNFALGIIAGSCYLLFLSFIFGSAFITQRGWPVVIGLLFLFATIIFFGAAAIYIYSFTDLVFILFVLMLPCVLFIPYYTRVIREKFSLKKIITEYVEKFRQRREPKSNILLVVLYVLLAAILSFLLWRGQTTQSIQSPWQTVSPKFFAVYFFASTVLLFYIMRSTRTKLPLILLIIHTALSSLVAFVVYTIGYGFDPFIHQATEKIINQTGTINPKPLYYLGQYALVIFIHKLTLIDVALIDRALVPFLFSFFVPLITFYVLSHWLTKKFALISTLIILLIPYSGFIMTAPQNLANLFFILTILLSLLYYRDILPWQILGLLGLATAVIHPLAGIPLLITVTLLILFKTMYTSYSRYISLYILAGSIFVIFLPLAFIFNGSGVSFALPHLHRADLWIISWVDKFDLPLNIVYLIQGNVLVVTLLVLWFGFRYIASHRLLKNNAGYLMAAAITFADFIIVKYFLTFPALNEYDKSDFVNRLSILTLYTLLPFLLIGAYWLIKSFWQHDYYTRTFVVLATAGLLTVSLYLSYPHVDQYEPAKFFSLGQSDIKAVYEIEQSANPNHIVLANQMVGAAAIKEFSFKKYYNGQFYYSMPNGSPHTFYDYYLDMIYQGATKDTMEKAMHDANVPEAYFVLNKYWNNYEKIAKQATASADSLTVVDDGAVLVFKYSR